MSTRDHQRLIGDVRVMSTCPSTSDVLLSRSKRRSGPRSASRTAQISSRVPSVLDNHIHGTHLPSCGAVHSIVNALIHRKMARRPEKNSSRPERRSAHCRGSQQATQVGLHQPLMRPNLPNIHLVGCWGWSHGFGSHTRLGPACWFLLISSPHFRKAPSTSAGLQRRIFDWTLLLKAAQTPTHLAGSYPNRRQRACPLESGVNYTLSPWGGYLNLGSGTREQPSYRRHLRVGRLSDRPVVRTPHARHCRFDRREWHL